MAVPYGDSHSSELQKFQKAHGPIITEVLKVPLNDSEQTVATLFPVNHADEISQSLLNHLHAVFAKEIEIGRTYPYIDQMTRDQFRDYWFSSFAAILLIGDYKDTAILKNEEQDWNNLFLGTYYIKSNYPGRCSHNCNAGFLVSFQFRKSAYKIGRNLGKTYLQWAPRLGYTYSVFNLVFESNIGSLRIWDSLGFERIGYVKNAGRLKGDEKPTGAIIFGKDLF